jgi:hypothetical protein
VGGGGAGKGKCRYILQTNLQPRSSLWQPLGTGKGGSEAVSADSWGHLLAHGLPAPPVFFSLFVNKCV